MKKSTLIALLVFAGLLAGAVVTLRQKPERNITRISFAAVDKSKIDRLEITGKNPIVAEKKGERWVLGDGKDAEETAVQGALDAIVKVESSELITRNTERFAELEVDDANGSRVAATSAGKTVADFVVGKAGAGGVYVRHGDAVYAVKGVSSYVFSKASAQWHRLKLFADKLEEVSRVEIALAGEAPWALVKSSDAWQLAEGLPVPAGFRFDANAARGLVSSLISASAKDILATDPGAEATKLDGKEDVLAFVAKDGARRELHLGGATSDGAIYAKVGGRDDLYALQEYTAKGLRKRMLDLRDLTLMKLEKEKATKVEIVDGKTRLVLEKQGADWKVASSSEAIPGDFQLDGAMVDRRLTTLSTTRAQKLAGETAPSTTGLGKPAARITVTLEGGATAELAFGASQKEDTQEVYFARGNADGAVYLVSKWQREQILGGLSTFQKRPEPAPGQGFDPAA
ncbi:MAG: DUF4340 domain-containing protein, partial [Deltaproteobacteria bacterium]|nr:DUF4340 domain-containing protein [Deltaproteobacteria bacterium]